MVAVQSTMLELGTPVPYFDLPSPALKRNFSNDDFHGKPLLVIFMCNHCPYVKHILGGLSEYAREYGLLGIDIVAINSNDAVNYPDDGPEIMLELSRRYDLSFPYLVDSAQTVARAFRAVCTPEFFLFDIDEKLVYRGQFDDSRPRNDIPVSGEDLRRASSQLLSGGAPDLDQKPSIGCSIKWLPGQEPHYAQ